MDFCFFVVCGSYTFQNLWFLPPEFFRRCTMFLQRKNFIWQFLADFFLWNVSPHKKECMPQFTSHGKCWTALLWAFLGQKLRWKVAKVFAEGIFYLCLSILSFTFERCVNVSKIIPAKFQSRPTFLAGFFSKRVTYDDDRRKTFLLASCCEHRDKPLIVAWLLRNAYFNYLRRFLAQIFSIDSHHAPLSLQKIWASSSFF